MKTKSPSVTPVSSKEKWQKLGQYSGEIKDKTGLGLFNILNDYGDFFLTNYPSQAETKSIHPTMKKIMKLFTQSCKEAYGLAIKDIKALGIKKVEKDYISKLKQL